VWLFDNFIVAF